MSNFGFYSGKQLFELKIEPRQWLVESLIKERDSVVIVGDAKAGKTLLKQQLCCALTSQQPFLDKYEVVKQCRVMDIQLEGELEDTQDRFKRMTETLEFEPDYYHLLFERPLELNAERHTRRLMHRIEQQCSPHIIFIDPVYFAFSGSLNDDTPVRAFLGNLRIIKDYFNCAIALVHHTHKMRINFKTGEIIDEGDEAMFGSKFFSAWPDHILLFIYDKRNDLRVLTCATQRSGEIAKKTQLKLIQPKPLYFKEVETQPTREDVIAHWLQQAEAGMTIKEMQDKTNLSRNTIYLSLKTLMLLGALEKTVTRPVVYKFKLNMGGYKKPPE